MKRSNGHIALAVIIVMFGVFAFTTDVVWIRVGALLGAAVALVAVLSRRDDD